jgi:tetratricopeptide (TPR) repeat protein
MLKHIKQWFLLAGLLSLLVVAVLPAAAQESLGEYIGTGMSLYAEGNYAQALAEFDDALAAYPDDAYSYNWRGFIHYLMGDMDQAWADMDRAIELGESFALVDRAMLYTREGDVVLAIVNYERGMLYYPYYEYTGDAAATYPEAFEFFVETYTPIIETYPDDFIALTIRGNAYANLGDYENALADYDRVLELAPQFRRVRQNRAMVQYRLGHYDCPCNPNP